MRSNVAKSKNGLKHFIFGLNAVADDAYSPHAIHSMHGPNFYLVHKNSCCRFSLRLTQYIAIVRLWKNYSIFYAKKHLYFL